MQKYKKYLEIIYGRNNHFGDFKPVPINIDNEEDYQSFKYIFCDSNIMRTVSLYDKKIPNSEQLSRDFIKMN